MPLTKQEIVRWYNTSIIPSDGTHELNKFMSDINRRFSAFIVTREDSGHCVYDRKSDLFKGVYYADRNKALKAFQKYGFTDDDIRNKMGMPPPLECRTTKARYRLQKYLQKCNTGQDT